MFNCLGAGKTHTMLGTVKEPGIMILTLNDLYKRIEETKHEKIYKVSMAYVEVLYYYVPLNVHIHNNSFCSL